MNLDFLKQFFATHAGLQSAIDGFQQALVSAAEDAVKAAIATIPVAGPIAEDIATPFLNAGEASVEALVRAELQKLGLIPGAPVTAAPVTAAPAVKAAPVPAGVQLAAPPPPPSGQDPRMAAKQADARARAASTVQNGQRQPTIDFGQRRLSGDDAEAAAETGL